jgi:hypothetical protein
MLIVSKCDLAHLAPVLYVFCGSGNHHADGGTRTAPEQARGDDVRCRGLGLHFRATVGKYPDGRIGELFLSNHRVNSMAGIMASDAAVVASIALQWGVPLDVIRHALMRDGRGKPSGPLGVVLDQLAEEGST